MPRAQTSVPIETPIRETFPAPAVLTLASGEERAIRSPALELQEALEEMLATQPARTIRPGAVVALAAGTIAVVGACSVFWVAVARMLISLA